MTGHGAIEAAKTVLEVADVAWSAVECCHHFQHIHQHDQEEKNESIDEIPNHREQELESLRLENLRLRGLLEENLMLLQNIAESGSLLQDCPSDLYTRLVSMVTSKDFLARLEHLSKALEERTSSQFPFKKPTEDDMQTVEVLINIDHQEPSWWVWITDDMVPSNIEEKSGIDNEHYIVVTEEHVLEAVVHFLAKCILSNPKVNILKPEEIQKALVQELGTLSKVGKIVEIWHAAKLFTALFTWGLAFAGIYKSGALKVAAKGLHATSKVLLTAL